MAGGGEPQAGSSLALWAPALHLASLDFLLLKGDVNHLYSDLSLYFLIKFFLAAYLLTLAKDPVTLAKYPFPRVGT